MITKNIKYYNNEIERLKERIRLLRAEKRVAVLVERQRGMNEKNNAETVSPGGNHGN